MTSHQAFERRLTDAMTQAVVTSQPSSTSDMVRVALVAGFGVMREELAEWFDEEVRAVGIPVPRAPRVPPAQPVVPVFHPGPFEVWIGLPGGGAAIRLDQGDDEHARRALPTEDDRARARVAIRDALRRLVRL